jgi:chromosome segregation ATPase
MTNPDLTAKYEEERLRTHSQSQIVYLQGQIDELRRLLKDQTNKYNWAMEQVRKTEASVAQVQSLFEQHTEEVTQSSDAVRRDVISLRREVAGALVKIDESVKPLREMQAQIQQVADARKQDRDFVAGWFGRVEALEQQILTLHAQIKEVDERQRQYTLQLDRLREADSVAIQEARKVGDELQIEKQSLRRQSVETQQLVVDFRAVLEEHASRLVRLDEIRQRIDLFAETLPQQYVELAAKFPDIIAEIKRVERLSTERFLMNQERLEDIRQQADEKIGTLQEADEQHLRQLTSWLERIDGWVRELEHRLGRTTTRLESAQQVHMTRIVEIENREMDTLTNLLASVRTQFERIKAAQVEVKGGEGN